MKILHITPTYYPATYWGGPIFSVLGLNNGLAQIPGVELKVLTTDSAGPMVAQRVDMNALDENWFPGNQEIIFARRIAGACVSLGLLARLVPLVRWADVVHLTATYSFPTIPTLVVCRWLDKPLVWSPRGTILDDDVWKTLRKRRLKQIWLGVCNALIRPGRVCLHVASEGEKAASLARLPKAVSAIVPNAVNVPAELPTREWLPGGKLRLLFIGRLDPKKGIENLLDTMKLLEEDTTIRLTICGSGKLKYEGSLKEKTKALGLLGKSIHFAGHVDGEDKRNILLNSDVCVAPSYSESFCMVVAEALAHGLPVITSHGTPWQLVEQKQCGLWVENDPETLVHSIRSIRKMDLEEMGKRGWRWMKNEFELDVIARKVYMVYQKIEKRNDETKNSSTLLR